MKIHWQKTVSGVVGFSRLGRDYWRSLANNINDPKTLAQLTQRARITTVAKFLHTLAPVWQQGYNHLKGNGRSAHNLIFQQVLNNALSGNLNDGFTVDPTKVLISRGPLTSAYIISATVAPTTQTVTVSWNNNSGAGTALASDKISIFVYNATKDINAYAPSTAQRSDESATLTYNTSWSGNTIYVYAFFSDSNADSHCLGFFTA